MIFSTIPVTFHLTFLALPTGLVILAVALAWWEARRSGSPPPASRSAAPEPDHPESP